MKLGNCHNIDDFLKLKKKRLPRAKLLPNK